MSHAAKADPSRRPGLVSADSSDYNHWNGAIVTSGPAPDQDSPRQDRKLTGKTSHTGMPPVAQASRARLGEDSVTKPEESRTTHQVGSERLRLIRQRLGSDFYEVPPASEQIAASVMAELKLDQESASALPN